MHFLPFPKQMTQNLFIIPSRNESVNLGAHNCIPPPCTEGTSLINHGFLNGKIPTRKASLSGRLFVTNLHAGKLRLAGGKWNGEGRVEIFHNGSWGTVCDDSWDVKDARVVCRQLGFPDANSAPGTARFGAGSGNIWMDDVKCLGNESSLNNCKHSGWNNHNCHHGKDASVICSG